MSDNLSFAHVRAKVRAATCPGLNFWEKSCNGKAFPPQPFLASRGQPRGGRGGGGVQPAQPRLAAARNTPIDAYMYEEF